MTIKTIFENRIYRLEYTKDQFDAQNENDGPYRVVNKYSGLTEHAAYVYPSALELFVRLSGHVEQLEATIREQHHAKQKAERKETDVFDGRTAEVRTILEEVRSRATPPVDLNAYRSFREDDETPN